MELNKPIFSSNENQMSRLKNTCRTVAITAALLQFWVTHNGIDTLLMTYMEIGEAYIRGDWQTAINGYYSPLYSILLALTMFIFKPSSYSLSTYGFSVNFSIYLFSLICLEFFLGKLVLYHREKMLALPKDSCISFSEKTIYLIAYGLFMYCSLFMILVSTTTSDILIPAFIYLITGIVLHIQTGKKSWFMFFLLGLILGLGYLAKSFMFPMAFVFLITAMITVYNHPKRLLFLLCSVIAFSLIAGPFIIALSKKKGYLTYGEAGKINYMFYVNKLPINWLDGINVSGRPVHPVRKIFDNPKIYEFNSPFEHVTYPFNYDDSYWYEGAHIHFDLKEQLSTIWSNCKMYHVLFFENKAELILGLLILIFYMNGRKQLYFRDILQYWILIFPALMSMVLYSLINVLDRYIAGFFLLLWMGLFLAIRLPNREESRRLITVVTAGILIVMAIRAAPTFSRYAARITKDVIRGKESNQPWEITTALNQTGIQTGDKIVVVGDDLCISWAKLAKVRITAEVFDHNNEDPVNNFWALYPTVRTNLSKALLREGIKAIVTGEIPYYAINYAKKTGWQEIGNTGYHAYILR